MIKPILALIMSLSVGSILATNYYVSPTGNNSNNGMSPIAPFRTLQHAANQTNPGDTVFVMNGTYFNPDYDKSDTKQDVVTITRSGTPEAWITFMPYPGHEPLIKFNGPFGIRVLSGENVNGRFTGAYIKISGFKVEGKALEIPLCEALEQPASCINTEGPKKWKYLGIGISVGSETISNTSHHVEISNCDVSYCPGAGIGSYRSDYITVSNCKIYNNCWRTTQGNSGIHIYHPQLSPVNDNSPFRFVFKNNFIFNNRLEVPWFRAPATCKGRTDGHGLIIDDARHTQSDNIPYTGKFLIENNVVYENGGAGIHVYSSDNVTIRNNTTYQNCATPERNEGEISLSRADNCKAFNNIMYARDGKKANLNKPTTNINTFGNNLVFSTVGYDFAGPNSIIGQDPFFVSTPVSILSSLPDCIAPEERYPIVTSIKNFALQSSSPAINAGSDEVEQTSTSDILGKERPQDGSSDIGAYEAITSDSVNTSLDVQTFDENGIVLYPNPNYDNEFFIKGIENQKITEVKVLDMVGRIVFSNTAHNLVEPFEIPSNTMRGIYIVLINLDNEKRVVKKLVIHR